MSLNSEHDPGPQVTCEVLSFSSGWFTPVSITATVTPVPSAPSRDAAVAFIVTRAVSTSVEARISPSPIPYTSPCSEKALMVLIGIEAVRNDSLSATNMF